MISKEIFGIGLARARHHGEISQKIPHMDAVVTPIEPFTRRPPFGPGQAEPDGLPLQDKAVKCGSNSATLMYFWPLCGQTTCNNVE